MLRKMLPEQPLNVAIYLLIIRILTHLPEQLAVMPDKQAGRSSYLPKQQV